MAAGGGLSSRLGVSKGQCEGDRGALRPWLVAAITQPGRDFFRERERAVALTGDASALATAYDYEAATMRNAAFALRILARNDKRGATSRFS